MVNSRTKGRVGEQELKNLFKDRFPNYNFERNWMANQQYAGDLLSRLFDTHLQHIQCKREQKLRLKDYLIQVLRDIGIHKEKDNKDREYVIILRQNQTPQKDNPLGEWQAVVSLETYFRYLELLEKENNGKM